MRYTILRLGGATVTDGTHHTGEEDTVIGDILGTAATAGTHRDGTGDGTGTTTGDGTLGTPVLIGDGMIRFMILGGDLHIGQATGLFTDREYTLDIILDITRLQALVQSPTMAKRSITEKGTATLHTTITGAMSQTAMQQADQAPAA